MRNDLPGVKRISKIRWNIKCPLLEAGYVVVDTNGYGEANQSQRDLILQEIQSAVLVVVLVSLQEDLQTIVMDQMSKRFPDFFSRAFIVVTKADLVEDPVQVKRRLALALKREHKFVMSPNNLAFVNFSDVTRQFSLHESERAYAPSFIKMLGAFRRIVERSFATQISIAASLINEKVAHLVKKIVLRSRGNEQKIRHKKAIKDFLNVVSVSLQRSLVRVEKLDFSAWKKREESFFDQIVKEEAPPGEELEAYRSRLIGERISEELRVKCEEFLEHKDSDFQIMMQDAYQVLKSVDGQGIELFSVQGVVQRLGMMDVMGSATVAIAVSATIVQTIASVGLYGLAVPALAFLYASRKFSLTEVLEDIRGELSMSFSTSSKTLNEASKILRRNLRDNVLASYHRVRQQFEGRLKELEEDLNSDWSEIGPEIADNYLQSLKDAHISVFTATHNDWNDGTLSTYSITEVAMFDADSRIYSAKIGGQVNLLLKEISSDELADAGEELFNHLVVSTGSGDTGSVVRAVGTKRIADLGRLCMVYVVDSESHSRLFDLSPSSKLMTDSVGQLLAACESLRACGISLHFLKNTTMLIEKDRLKLFSLVGSRFVGSNRTNLDEDEANLACIKVLQILEWDASFEGVNPVNSSDTQFPGLSLMLEALMSGHIQQVPHILRAGQRQWKTLAIDGGGVRSIIACLILQELERVIGKRLFNLFDLIGGSETGAWLAILVGASKVSAQQLREHCVFEREYASQIFGKGDFRREDKHSAPWVFALCHRQDSNGEQSCVVRNYSLGEDCWQTNLLAIASASDVEQSVTRLEGDEQVKYSSAGEMNPVNHAIKEADKLNQSMSLMVSVGCGRESEEKQSAGLAGAIGGDTLLQLWRLKGSCQANHNEANEECERRGIKYVRFDPVIPTVFFKKASWTRAMSAELQDVMNEYFQSPDFLDNAQSILELMASEDAPTIE
eukprot:TRINITY_DN4095_c0_g2_i1.p1 TRINITY_DN4095_c0_g2~~TRINITY_DN4095_c0_g2_i1.p1  ORF type:complete len:973 (-),score=256.49 TRINITY_DN4095_c0_g2_i1:1864-4740(-)